MRNDNTTETEPASLLPLDTQLLQDGIRRRRQHYSRPLKIRRVPMQHGWFWLIEGFMLWVRNPAFLSFLTICFIVGITVAAIPPYLGELLAPILYPGLLLGVFNGCRAIDRKRTLSPGLLISGFHRHAFDLLLAGFINFIVITIVLLGSLPIDGGMVWQLGVHAKMPDMAAVPSSSLYPLFAAAVLIIWGVIYLFVPQLIGWWRLSVPRALIYSLKGCLLNWLPFLIYAFCLSFFIIALPFFVINFFELIYEGLGKLVCLVYLLLISPALIASFYVAARDIFGFPRRRKHKRRPSSPVADEHRKRKAQA